MNKKKGILLAGGTGSRFRPITYSVNKHLLPIYEKPMFFYPLSILMMGGIKEIQIVSDTKSLIEFEKILSKINIDVKFHFKEQNKPSGIADGIIKSKDFIGKSDFALILGDNFFYGQSLSDQIKELMKKKNCIVTVQNKKPQNYGVVKFKNKKIIDIIEKPTKFISNTIVTGLYVFDNNCIKIAEKLKPSDRGELEISDLNSYLIKKNKLHSINLGRGSVWLDTGTPDDLLKASEFVKLIEDRSGFEIANLKEINEKFIKKK